MKHTGRHMTGKLSFCRKLALLVGMLVTLGVSNALAAQYVFMSGNNYIYVNDNGALTTTSSFSPDVLWTGTSGSNFQNNGYYLGCTRSTSWMILTTRYNYTPTVSKTVPSYGQNITVSNNKIYFNGTKYSSGTKEDYYYIWSNSSCSVNSSTSNAISVYLVEVTPHTHNNPGSVTLTADGGKNTLSSTTDYNNNTILFHPTISQNFRPEYTTYSFNNTTHNWYTDTDHGTDTPASQVRIDQCTTVWSIEGAAADYVTISGDQYFATLKYDKIVPNTTTITVRLSVRALDMGFEKSGSWDVRLIGNSDPKYYYSASTDVNLTEGGTATVNVPGGQPGSSISWNSLGQSSTVIFTATPNLAYKFNGWYDNDAGTGNAVSTDATFEYQATSTSDNRSRPSSVKFYAIFEQESKFCYSATAIASPSTGGAATAATPEGTSNTTVSWDDWSKKNIATFNAINAADYVFIGWFTNSEGTGNAVSTNEEYYQEIESNSIDSDNPTNLTLYAIFKTPPTFYFSASAYASPTAGGTAAASWTTKQVKGTSHNSTSASASITFTATANSGYQFIGWYDNQNGTGNAVSTSASYTTNVTSSSEDSANPGNTTLYAIFKEIPTFYFAATATPKPTDGGTASVTLTTNNVTATNWNDQSATTTATFTATVNNGYQFIGWYDNQDGTGTAKSTSLSYQEQITSTSTTNGSPTTTTRYAIFKEIPTFYFAATATPEPQGGGTASVTLTANNVKGVNWDDASATTTAKYSATAAEHYFFAGWSATQNGNIESTNNPYTKTITSMSKNSGSPTNTTMYARFTALPTEIHASNVTVETGSTAQITVTLTPNDAYRNLSFTSNDTRFATVNDQGVVTGVAGGNTTVTVKALDNKGREICQTTAQISVLGTVTDNNAGYVIFNGTYYLDNNDPYNASVTRFNPKTCLWIGQSGGKFHNEDGYYLRNNRDPLVTKNENEGADCTIKGTENGTTGAQIWTSNTQYIRWSSNQQYHIGWEVNNGYDQNNYVFKVTKITHSEQSVSPTISGPTEISTIGANAGTFSRTDDATYVMGYIDYIFYNKTHHYFKTDNSTNLNAVPTAEEFTYRWSIIGADGYATIDQSSGVITYSTSPEEDITATVRLTATSTNKTFTVDQDVVIKSTYVDPTAISADPITLYVGQNGDITYQLTAENTPIFNYVVANSANTEIFTVASQNPQRHGSVTLRGVAVGTANLTLSAKTRVNRSVEACATTVLITVTQKLANPTVNRVDETTFNFSCSTVNDGVKFYYTINGSNPTTSDNYVTAGSSITLQRNATIRVMAVKEGYEDSNVTMFTNTPEPSGSGTQQDPYLISYAEQLDWFMNSTDHNTANKHAKIIADISGASSVTHSISNFTGSFDGGYYKIDGLTHALFTSINGGTVKNVMLDNVSISSGTNVGAIVNEASGSSKIYNCGVLSTNGSSISGSGSVGGIAGLIDGYTKVVNCYNYATIAGGSYAAGIVGRNGGSSASSYTYSNACSSLTGWTTSTNVGTTQNARPHFIVNTWSTENDGSGMSTPFIEYWNNAGTNLANTNIRLVLEGVPQGTYTVSCLVRLYNESNQNNPSGISFFTDGGTAKTTAINGTQATYNNHRLIYTTVSTSVTVNANGRLTVGFNVNNVQNCNWLAFKNLTVTPQSGSSNPNTRISNCMMYGDITSGTNKSPVYCGTHISNAQNFTEYNYYRSRANLTYTAYNDQLAIDKDEYLTRFPFYRHIQNTHREMASYFLFGDYTTDHVNEIGHWVVKPEIAPYPIIEPWETGTKKTTEGIRDNLPNTSESYAGKLLTNMGSNGYLRVNVKIGSNTYTSDLPITDMDTLNYDFTWGKVVLPFANEYSGWTRDYSKVITGWKITGITGGTAGTLTNYNFADRDCTAKDLYSNSGYIYAQGGNYIVPNGVTAIDIEANLANAFYLSDPAHDMGYNTSYGGATQLGGTVSTTYHNRTVYTNLETLIAAMGNASDPHTQAIVLVGNFHYNQAAIGTCFNTEKGLTIMSVDDDNNQEPDYGWYSYHNTDRTNVPSLRFDFVPNIGIGMAARVTGSTPYPTIGIWHARGWFELTETCVSMMSECEINSNLFDATDNGKGNNRWIANSGYFIQIVRARNGNCNRLSYIQIGGNAYVKELYPGSHTDAAYTSTLCPIIVNGGEIEQCFMTGYNANGKASGQNIYFWSAGGKMHKWLAAYLEEPNTNGVNVTAKVDHAIIGRFFGGGTSTSARITGNINVTMNNSLVDFYCGGPEFGDMANGKTVTTNATGTTFGEFYGAGFGGTSITYSRDAQNAGVGFASDLDFPLAFTNYTGNRLRVDGTFGIGSCYKFEYIHYAGGSQGVARFYSGYASFSLAQTGSVTNTLNGCTIKKSFYGGGCQGTVSGNATSTLTDCYIEGNAFAGGYRAPATTVNVYPATQPTYSHYTKETGLFSDFGTVEPEVYTWQHANQAGSDQNAKILYTTTDMSNLGAVTGKATITINGDTYVGGLIDNQPNGGVFGGGNESPVNGQTEVNIASSNTYSIANVYGGANKANVGNNTVINVTSGTIGNVFGANNVSGTKNGTVTVNINQASGKTVLITDDVYGGGNLAAYSGDPTIYMRGGTVSGTVFGGGLGSTAAVSGNTTIDMTGGSVASMFGGGSEANTSGSTSISVTGGTVTDEMYGGGALANVGGSTTISLTGGTVGDVYGGGLGQLASGDAQAVEATVSGNTLITLNGSAVTGTIYGCNNINGSPKGTATIHIRQTVPTGNETDENPYHVAGVYGGGNKAAYIPASPSTTTASTLVYLHECDNSIQYVYGGGNAASTPANHLIIEGGYIDYVFGGGNGAGADNPGANVGYYTDVDDEGNPGAQYGTGEAKTEILGGIINHVFGGSNMKGNIRVKALSIFDADENDPGACTFQIGEVYGAGNEAYMDGSIEMVLECIPGFDVLYGGAKNAKIGNDIKLTITNGTFGTIFGGNNLGGTIGGSITINIEETGCHPIIIGSLYGGGNQAAYPIPAGKALNVNVRSCTSIGTIYGGGLGSETDASKGVVTGDTHVNVQMVPGKWAVDNALGTIGTIFGGGNIAAVNGDTYVNIATEATTTFDSLNENKTKNVVGANITDNIYGGGNKAPITGQTHVLIGR